MILNGAFGGNKHAHLHTHTWNITDYHWPSDHLCWCLEMILQMHPWQTRWQYLTIACKGLVMSSSMNPALAKWLEATPDSGLYTPSSPFSSTFTHFQHLSAYISCIFGDLASLSILSIFLFQCWGCWGLHSTWSTPIMPKQTKSHWSPQGSEAQSFRDVPSSEQVPRTLFIVLSKSFELQTGVQMCPKFPQWSKMEIPALPGSNGNAVFFLVCKIIGIVLMVSVYCTLLGHVREAWRTNYKDTVWRSKVL